jgi:hypothetical protein
MTYHVTIEHRPSQGLYRSLAPTAGALGALLQGRLGTAAKVLVAACGSDQQPQPVAVEYELGGEGRFASHDQVVDFVAAVMEQAGLYAVRAVVSEVVRHYVAGAVVSGATALVGTRDASPWVILVATVVATGVGALAGGQIEQEVAKLDAQRHPYGGWTWYQLPHGPASGWSAA